MHKITLLPGNEVIEVEAGANLRESLIKAGHEIKSPCGGCASCGQCIVVIRDGQESLSEVSFEEKQIIGNVFHITQERLSCQTTIQSGDVTVDISGHMKKKTPTVTKRRTRAEADSIIEERKENSKNRPERQGGFKKPKSFTTKND